MPQSSPSCSSCVCCGAADEPAPCCNSSKCEMNIQQQKSLPCCHDEEENSINCPMCKQAMAKAQSSCKICAKSVSNLCSICKEQMEKQDNTCPSCKKEGMKKIEKEIRCPSCSRTVHLQCSMPEGIPSFSIMLIPDKLLKDSSTNTRCCEESDEEELCCKSSKSSVKKKDSSMTEKPSKASCAEDCKNLKKLEKQSAGQAPIPKPPDEKPPDQSAIKPSDEKKNKPTVECSKECIAQAGDENCSCIFPPAFKQYTCTGKIAGVCDCTKK